MSPELLKAYLDVIGPYIGCAAGAIFIAYMMRRDL